MTPPQPIAAAFSHPRRVVVTGVGMICPLGLTSAEVWQQFTADGDPEPLAVGLPTEGFMGRLDGWELENSERAGRMSPGGQYALAAATDACQQARIDLESVDTARVGVLVGTMFGGLHETVKTRQLVDKGKIRRAGGTGTVRIMNSGAAVNMAAQLKLRGAAMSNSSGFATGLDNIGCGYEWVRDGLVDVAICGATEENCAPYLGRQFSAWETSSAFTDRTQTIMVRPFDTQREGSILSAGSGIVVLEPMENVQQRGATPLAEICGYVSRFEPATVIDDFGTALVSAISETAAQVKSAGITGTLQAVSGAAGFRAADAQHAAAISQALGRDTQTTSLAGWLGHSLAASSAWSAAVGALMLSAGSFIRCRGLKQRAADCDGIQPVTDSGVRTAAALFVTAGGLGFASCLALRNIT